MTATIAHHARLREPPIGRVVPRFSVVRAAAHEIMADVMRFEARTHEPPLNHNRRRFSCRCGTFKPSRLQRRSRRDVRQKCWRCAPGPPVMGGLGLATLARKVDASR